MAENKQNKKVAAKKSNTKKLNDKYEGLIIEEGLAKDLSALYKVIGDMTRLKILYALIKENLCVREIMEVANISQSLASHQLKVLKDHDLVISKKRKNEVVYSLADDHVRWLIDIAVAHLTEEILV